MDLFCSITAGEPSGECQTAETGIERCRSDTLGQLRCPSQILHCNCRADVELVDYIFGRHVEKRVFLSVGGRKLPPPVRSGYRETVDPRVLFWTGSCAGSCDVGQWSPLVLTLTDAEGVGEGLRVVTFSCILALKSPEVKPKRDSRMAAVGSFTGFMCSVASQFGSEVVLAGDCTNRHRRRGQVIAMENTAW